MLDLKAAMEFLDEQSVKANGADGTLRFQALPDGTRRHIAVHANGIIGVPDESGTEHPVFFQDETPDREHTVQTLDGLAELFRHHGFTGGDANPNVKVTRVAIPDAEELIGVASGPAGPVVYLDSSDWTVTVVLDDSPDSYRADVVRLGLRPTPEFQLLTELESDGWTFRDQNRMIDLFRFRLAGNCQTVPEKKKLLHKFEKLAFSERVAASDQQGRSSYAQDAEMQGGATPEQFEDRIELTFRCFTDTRLPATRTVSLLLHVDADKRAFVIVPVPGELDRVQAEERSAVRGVLQALGVPVIDGAP